MRRLILFVLSLAVLTSVAAFAENDHYKNGQTLAGSWKIQVIIPAGKSSCPQDTPGGFCAIFAMATATDEGTIIQTAALPGVSTGHGVWTRTGLRQFTVTTTYFRLDSTGLPIGTAETISVITVKQNGVEASGTYSNQLYDLAGSLIPNAGFEATATATRIVP